MSARRKEGESTVIRNAAYRCVQMQSLTPSPSPVSSPANAAEVQAAGDFFQSGPNFSSRGAAAADPTGWSQLRQRFSNLQESGVIR